MKILSLIFGLLLVAGCNGQNTTPEQRVRTTLEAIETAAQDRSLSRIMEHVSDQFVDHQGNDKEAIKNYVQLHILRNQSINIFSKVNSIEMANEFAAVEMSVAMAARGVDLSNEAGRLKANTYQFSLVLKEDGDAWLIHSVSWRRGW